MPKNKTEHLISYFILSDIGLMSVDLQLERMNYITSAYRDLRACACMQQNVNL
jgi:hypothetical protein